jgi:hypothetical protein
MASSIENWGNLYPSENISLTPEIGISMFQGAFRLESTLLFLFFQGMSTSDEISLMNSPVRLFLPPFLRHGQAQGLIMPGRFRLT